MRLNRQGREFYRVEIVTDPVVTGGWEASFDDGATWAGQTLVAGFPAWLVAGPDADPGDAVAVVNASQVKPLLRAIDNPEVIVRGGPRINIV